MKTTTPFDDALFDSLEEAEMKLSVGYCVLDDHLADRLELIAKDASLPPAYRARAMFLMCRFG